LRYDDQFMENPRNTPQTLLVLVAALALLLGSVGTAVAGPGLTQKAVKKIAAKVVKKKARTLTVHNTTLLAGQPASAYRNDVHRFRLQGGSPSATKTFVFDGLPAGSYLVSYSVVLTSNQASLCSMDPTGSSLTREAVSAGSAAGNIAVVSGSGAVVLDGVTRPVLRCNAHPSGVIEVQAGVDVPSTVVFTQVGSLTTTSTPQS